MTISVEQFVRKVDRIGEAIPAGSRDAVFASSLVLVTTIRKFLDRAMDGHKELRSASTGGSRKLGVGFDVRERDGKAHALINARGAFHLIEGPTSDHEIGGRRGTLTKTGRVRRQGASVLKVGGDFYSRVSVTGQKGKHPFDHGITAAQRPAVQAFNKTFEQRWSKALRG